MIKLTKTQAEQSKHLRGLLNDTIMGHQARTQGSDPKTGFVTFDVDVVIHTLAGLVAESLLVSDSTAKRDRRLYHLDAVVLDQLYAHDKKRRPPELA